MNSRNYKYALLLVAAVSITATGAMSQAYAQSVEDGMDGYVKGTSGIYTGNPNECWIDDGDGICYHVLSILVIQPGCLQQHHSYSSCPLVSVSFMAD